MVACDFCFSLASHHHRHLRRNGCPRPSPLFCLVQRPPANPYSTRFTPLPLITKTCFHPPLLRSGNASTTVRFILCRRGPGEPYKTSGTDSHPPHTHACPPRPVFKASVLRPLPAPYIGTYRVVCLFRTVLYARIDLANYDGKNTSA